MKLYLDDIREAPEGWVLVRSYAACVDALRLSTEPVTHLSLDHDLSLEHYSGDYTKERTGYDVMCWIEDCKHRNPRYKLPEITFHTANPVGRARMQQVLDRIKKGLA